MRDYIEVKIHNTHHLKDDDYILTIEGCTFNNCKNELALICKLTNTMNQKSFLLKESLAVGGKKYKKIIRQLYAGDDGDIVAVNTDDFSRYVGNVKLKIRGKHFYIDWRTIKPVQSLLGELWEHYHPEIFE